MASTGAGSTAAASPAGDAMIGFEGPEKNLEIDFVPSKGPKYGMRSISKDQWQAILDEAKCSILGEIYDEDCTAYLLSESSLFVYSHKIIAKTCGTTTLLRMLPPLLERVAAKKMEVEWVAYSRKDFLFPYEQVFPHRSTTEEIAFLHRFFPTGSAHVLGPLTSDHWVVFVADYCERPPTESTDVTLDIKMFDICDGMSRLLHEDQAVEEAAKAGVQLGSKSKAPSAKSGKEEEEEEDSPGAASQGSDAGDSPVSTDSDSKEAPAEGEGGEEGGEPKGMDEREEEEKGGAAGGGKGDKSCADLGKLAACPGPSSAVAKYVTQRSGLTAVLPGSTVHAYMFEPCGYSANGLLDGSYWTVHVTPEKHCSYASFETNVRASSLRPLVRAVLALFRPKRFTLTLFADAQGVKEMTDLPVEPYIKCQEEVAKEAERQGQAGLGPVSQGEDPQRWKLTDKSHTEFAGDYCVVLANYRDVRSPPSRVLSPAVKASFGAAVAGGQGQGGASGAAAEAEDSPAIAAAAGLSQGTGVQAVPSKAGTGKDAASGSGSSIGGAASLGLAAGAGTGARAAASSSEPVSRAVGEGVALPGHVSLPHGGPGGS